MLHPAVKTNSKKVILAGGAGRIGRVLEKEYLSRGYNLLILTRKPQKEHHIYWDGESRDQENADSWMKQLENTHLLINLSGHSILSKNRDKIYNSRIKSTKILGEAVAQLKAPPETWLQMSATGIYSHRFEGFDDEFEGVLDQGDASDFSNFMKNLIQDWERACYSSQTPLTRKIILRMSFFMSVHPEGFFGLCTRLTKKGLGGSLAGGKQFISWIHEKDLIRSIDFILKDKSIKSPVNLSSPHPISQKNLMKTLRKKWNIPFGLPVGKSLLKVISFFGGVEPDLVLKSSRVYPKRLLKHGFKFEYPDWEQASEELVRRHKKT